VIDRDAARTPSAVLWGMAQRKRLNPRLTIFGNHRKESWGHQRSRRKLTLQLRRQALISRGLEAPFGIRLEFHQAISMVDSTILLIWD
jgi:hypothetical protein